MNISVANLSFSYPSGVEALRDVSLAITSGESVAIVGENGAGKTTLVKHFNGLLKPSDGVVEVGEWDTRLVSVARLAGRVGYVFQNPDDQLFERTVIKEASFGPRNLGHTEPRARQAARRALAMVGLEKDLEKHPYDLHLSQRKLLALASVIAMETPVIVLDEPTTGQDARGLSRISDIVENLKAAGRTVVVITHDMDFAAEHFARVVVMAAGKVLADGPAVDVMARADVLAAAEVEPPQVVRLARSLGLSETPLTVEDFVELLRRKRQEGTWLRPSS